QGVKRLRARGLPEHASFPPRQKATGGDPLRSRRPQTLQMSGYFKLAMAVRSNRPDTTKLAPHQLEPKPPGLIEVTSPVKRAVLSLVKALQSPLFMSVSK